MKKELKLVVHRQVIPIFLLMFALIIGTVPVVSAKIMETRTFRDAFAITPFHSVVVDEQIVTPEGLIVKGHMIKRRCFYQDQSAYVRLSTGKTVWVYTDVAIDPNAHRGSRPPSDLAQEWGPWLIKANMNELPVSYEIWIKHECPNEPHPQDNLFASGRWENITYKVENTK
jgi:hypothetical protein